MPLSTLIVPVLLAFTACFAARKRVDVYAALTKGAEEGLAVLLHILPTLIALLSAVYMLRASRPRARRARHSCRNRAAAVHPPHLRQRRAGRRIGDHAHAWRGFLYWPRGGCHARLERNDILHCCRLLRRGRNHQNALHHSRRPLRRRSDVPLLGIFCAPVLRRVKKRTAAGQSSFLFLFRSHADAQGTLAPLPADVDRVAQGKHTAGLFNFPFDRLRLHRDRQGSVGYGIE